MKLKLTSSIVTYNTSREDLSNILNCVNKSIIEKVYIIDNSKTDIIGSYVGELSSKVEYIFNNKNIGYGDAHNIGIARSSKDGGKYHIIINPDIIFEGNTIENLHKFMENNSEVGLVMPKVIYPSGELQPLCKLLPSPVDLIIRRFLPFKKVVANIMNKYELSTYNYDKAIEVPFLSGCFMFCRTEALAKINGFDTRYFMYCEDIDLCRKISGAGYKTICNPFDTIIHVHQRESYVKPRLLFIHISSAIKYFNKWGWIIDKNRKAVNRATLEQLK